MPDTAEVTTSIATYSVSPGFQFKEEVLKKYPDLIRLQIVRGEGSAQVIAHWNDIEKARGHQDAFLTEMAEANARKFVGIDGGSFPLPRPKSRLARIIDWIARSWKVVLATSSVLALIWTVFSEHFLHFFAPPKIDVIVGEEAPVTLDASSNSKATLNVVAKNDSLRSQSVMVCEATSESGIDVARDCRIITSLIQVGEKKELDIGIKTHKPGTYTLLLECTSRSGIWRLSAKSAFEVKVRVWPVKQWSSLQLSSVSSRSCTMSGTFTPGVESEKGWRAEAEVTDLPHIQFTDASFQEYRTESSNCAKIPGAGSIAVFRSTQLQPFKSVQFDLLVSSDKDLAEPDWRNVAMSIQRGLAFSRTE